MQLVQVGLRAACRVPEAEVGELHREALARLRM